MSDLVITGGDTGIDIGSQQVRTPAGARASARFHHCCAAPRMTHDAPVPPPPIARGDAPAVDDAQRDDLWRAEHLHRRDLELGLRAVRSAPLQLPRGDRLHGRLHRKHPPPRFDAHGRRHWRVHWLPRARTRPGPATRERDGDARADARDGLPRQRGRHGDGGCEAMEGGGAPGVVQRVVKTAERPLQCGAAEAHCRLPRCCPYRRWALRPRTAQAVETPAPLGSIPRVSARDPPLMSPPYRCAQVALWVQGRVFNGSAPAPGPVRRTARQRRASCPC